MKKSKLGYKRYSPDVNRSYNVIPSNRITMRDVDFPVYGIDDFGYAQMMYPGVDYEFPGSQVFELPVRQTGGQRDTIYTSNPNDSGLKAYSDSLALYKNYKKPPLGYVPITESDSPTAREYVKKNTINQLKNLYYSPTGSISGTESMVYYDAPPKKPVQPVEYREVSKAVVKPKELLLDINSSESKVKRTTRLPESIDSIKQDASGVNVYVTVNGKTSVIPKKDYPSWRMENKDLYDAYTAKLAYGGEQLQYAQFGGMRRGKVDRILNENKDLNFVQRMYQSNTPSIMIPGQNSPSTHFMESGDGRVYPTVVQMPDGNLQYLGENAYNYAMETGEYIEFPNDRQARRFASNKGYKKGTGVLDEFASGGLKQWFAEKWVDVKTGKDCGRSGKDKSGRPYPACRPSRRVNSTTPKTASEMSSSEKARFKREKTSGQRISYNHSRKQRGGQMSGSVGYDSMYNSPIAAFRYMMNPKDESKYYGEVYGTKQGPGIAAGIDYDNQKYGTQGMIRLGVDPLRGASIRAQGGKRFNPIDNRREELSYGPYGGVNFQTNDYYQFAGTGNELRINNFRPRLSYGANAEYNRELANRGRFSIEGDLGVSIGDKYASLDKFQAEPYGAIKATYSPPIYNKNTKKKPSSNRKPSPTTYSPRGYQLGGQMTPQGITPAFFTGMKDATVDAFKSFMSSSDQPMQPTQPEAVDWRKMKRPAQIKYGIDQVVNLELEDKRRALENLLESTAYMENKYGEDPNAYGRKYTSSFMSIDPIALKDMFTGRGDKGRYNNAQKAQFENFKKLGLPVTQDEFDSKLREDDPVAAMAAARFRYALVPEALPNMNNSKAMYDYWLKYYNGNGVLKHQSKEKAYKTFLKGYKLALKND